MAQIQYGFQQLIRHLLRGFYRFMLVQPVQNGHESAPNSDFNDHPSGLLPHTVSAEWMLAKYLRHYPDDSSFFRVIRYTEQVPVLAPQA